MHSARRVNLMSREKYVKPEVEIEEYSAVDVMTSSKSTNDDLHSLDDYDYGQH